MKDHSLSTRFALPLIVLLCLLLSGIAHAGAVVFFSQDGRLTAVDDPSVMDPVSALNALVAGPSAWGLVSSIPAGTKLRNIDITADGVTVDFSSAILAGLDEVAVESIFKQVNWTMRQFRLDKSVKLTVNGKLLSDYLPPTPQIEPAAATMMAVEATTLTGSLSDRSITLSPGHGLFWNGSGWYTQRPAYCAPLNQEDYHNLEMCQYLRVFLENDGMLVKVPRETDKNAPGNYNGFPWWQMASPYYLQAQGYPCSVYGSYSGCSLGDGATEVNDDIRARPLASDLDNTDIYISVHTNGLAGNCYGGSCPTGTETYYDLTSKEHKNYGVVSQTLANAVNPAIMSAIVANVDGTWTCHGACTKDSAGNYGEIRIPDRAAVLVELAFHDSCDRDADINHLRDNFFRSAAMWGIYKGVCDYYGVAPTWGFYSSEYVSDDIPATMAPGEVRQVHITMRNKGGVWSEARAFRLGAVGDTDPFSTATRYTIAGEVGPSGEYTFALNFTAPTTEGDYLTDWQMVRDGVTWFGATLSHPVHVGAPDTEPPTVPTNLAANAVSGTQVDLTWTASTDNIGVTGYNVYRDSVNIGSSATTSYSDTTCSPNTTYTYEVTAYDAAENESGMSTPAVVTTPGDTTPPVISNVAAVGSRTTATVTWNTDEPATSQVEYGLTTAYGSLTTIDTNLVTGHSVGLSGLTRRTTYHYRVRSKDAAQNEAVSGDYTFATN